MEMQTYDGICKYCGSVKLIMAYDQADADEKVTEKCDCGGADKEKKKKTLKKLLENLSGIEASKNGFNPIDRSVFEIINQLIEMTVDEEISKVRVTVDGTTITINRTSEKIKISRKAINNRGGEV